MLERPSTRVTELGPRAQRTVARIIQATREVFLTRGYAGTTVDEIANIADVSRASFYTYFPTKREVLLAVGDLAATESLAAIDTLGASMDKLPVFAIRSRARAGAPTTTGPRSMELGVSSTEAALAGAPRPVPP